MSKWITDFRVTDISSQRNGIAGRPFHAVRFSCTLTDFNPPRFMPNMLAIVPSDPRREDGDHEFYVVDLNDPKECWRGDNFAELLMQAINEKGG